MVCIVYGKTYAEQLRVRRSICTDLDFATSCNAAVGWTVNATSAACTTAGLPAGCSVAQAWGFDSSYLSYGTPPVPLGVNNSVEPAQNFILSGQPCRWVGSAQRNESLWLAPDKISADCVAASAVTINQWAVLNLAGWSESAQFVNESSCIFCMCSVLMTTTPALWWDSVDAWPHRAVVRTSAGVAPCSAQAAEAAAFAGLQAAAVILVVILNTVLSATAVMLARFERHNTVAEQVFPNLCMTLKSTP